MKKAVRFFMDTPPPVDPRITDPLARRLMVMHGYILPVEYGRSIPPAFKSGWGPQQDERVRGWEEVREGG